MSPGSVIRISLALFGAYLCASGVEVLLHESGHGIAAFLLGADITRFDVHPFRRSEVAMSYDSGRRAESSLLFSTAGIAFAVLISGVAYLATRRKSHFFLPVQFLLPTALLAEGQYVVDGSLCNYGDPSEIASLAYFPFWVLALLGVLMVCAGAVLVVRLMANVGLDQHATWWSRSLALLALAVTYLPGAVYTAKAQDSLPEVLAVTGVGFVCMFIFALFGGVLVHLLRRRLSWIMVKTGPEASWTNAIVAIAAGAIVVGMMLSVQAFCAKQLQVADPGAGTISSRESSLPVC